MSTATMYAGKILKDLIASKGEALGVSDHWLVEVKRRIQLLDTPAKDEAFPFYVGVVEDPRDHRGKFTIVLGQHQRPVLTVLASADYDREDNVFKPTLSVRSEPDAEHVWSFPPRKARASEASPGAFNVDDCTRAIGKHLAHIAMFNPGSLL